MLSNNKKHMLIVKSNTCALIAFVSPVVAKIYSIAISKKIRGVILFNAPVM